MNTNYVLIDSKQRSLLSPTTWGHPPSEALDKIQPGFYVKVGVESNDDSGPGERFWGRVVEPFGRQWVIQINQNLVHTRLHGLKDEDRLGVEQRHIFGILDPGGK